MLPFVDLAPVVDLVAPRMPAHLERVLRDREFLGRGSVQALEDALARQLEAQHAVVCNSGTDALTLALLATHAQGHVAIPDLTFWGTYEAVVRAAATPLLLDVDPETLQLDLPGFKQAFERWRFRTAIFVHLFGWTSPQLIELRAFCREHEITLIEDAAQAFGIRLDGVSVFTGAHIAALSFHPAKVIGGMSDGGAVLTEDANLAQAVRMFADHGRTDHYAHAFAGVCSRMSGISASYLHTLLDYADRILAIRRRLLDSYATLAGNDPIPGVRLHAPPPGVTGNGYLVVTTIEGRNTEALAERMRRREVRTARVYPRPLSLQEGAIGCARDDLKHAEAFCTRVLNLPSWYGMLESDCAVAWRALREAMK